MNHTIILESELEEDNRYEALITRTITAALDVQGVSVPCEVNVLLTGNDGIRGINLEQRGEDKPTDVLSFPMFDLTAGVNPARSDADHGTGLVPLGDMVISLERAAAQAQEYGHGIERELGYLTVHSVLHLLGYDHMDDGVQKAEMRAHEEAILTKLGITRGE